MITVKKDSIFEFTEKKSVFIGQVFYAKTVDEAMEKVQSVRNAHPDATHVCWAYSVCGGTQRRASDDGEPQGTSGVPMLQMMVKEGITNVVVVVTRYFGGIKLGTGGLVRAYTNTAKAALEDAGIHHVKDQTVIVASMDYTHLGKLQNEEKDGYFTIADTAYTDVITVTLHAEPEDADRVKGFLSELTGGKYILVEELETLV